MRRLSRGITGWPGELATRAWTSSSKAPGLVGPVTRSLVQVRIAKASARPAPNWSARCTCPSAARLLLFSLRLGSARRFALRRQRDLHFRQHPVSLVRADQTPADRIPHQLFGVLDREVADAGRRADRLDERVRHRAPKHAGDSGESLEQRGDLRPAELGWHRHRCPRVEGGANLLPLPRRRKQFPYRPYATPTANTL